MALAFGVIKMSVLLLYRRLFVGRSFNYYSLVMCAVIFLWSVGFFFAFAFQCGVDLSSSWTSAQATKQKCVDIIALYLGYAVSDVLTDVLVLATPIPIVWKLQMSFSNKIGLTCIFLLGTLWVGLLVLWFVHWWFADMLEHRSTVCGVVRMVIVIIETYCEQRSFQRVKSVLTTKNRH